MGFGFGSGLAIFAFEPVELQSFGLEPVGLVKFAIKACDMGKISSNLCKSSLFGLSKKPAGSGTN